MARSKSPVRSVPAWSPGRTPTPDVMIGRLANSDGPRMTHALLRGSPALDAECPSVDQRGVVRPLMASPEGNFPGFWPKSHTFGAAMALSFR